MMESKINEMASKLEAATKDQVDKLNLILDEMAKANEIDVFGKITCEEIGYYDEVVRGQLELSAEEYDSDTMTLQDFISETVKKLAECNLVPKLYVNQYEESIEESDYVSYPYLEYEFKQILGIEDDDD